ncbi:response regulator transcription factor [Opitutales bacterium ASA1]|nr:response regulator transcription factor [Opitutales bacterium ASA1]
MTKVQQTAGPGEIGPSEGAEKSVLIVDDEPDVTSLVAYHLRAKGYRVATLNDPNQIMGLARSFNPDLVILDVMMPDLSGTQICRMLRADPALRGVPVIFLSAKAEESARVQGLEVGADDYVCKPFSTKELVLRVQSIFRRLAEVKAGDSAVPLQIGKVTLDAEHHRVEVAGEHVELTATEFKLLRVLMERKGRVQARDHLLLNVWNYETEIETRTVDTHIRRLREKLGSEASLIETVRGVGYRMVDRKPEACLT